MGITGPAAGLEGNMGNHTEGGVRVDATVRRELMLERNLADARRCHETKVNECKRLKKILADWQVFAADIQAGDAAGMDWLEDLKARTQRALDA